jgi:hypothetical protein
MRSLSTLASFQFVAAMVLPLFVLWNNLAGRRRFHHDACPDTIFVRRPLFCPKPLKFYPAVGFYLGAKFHSRGRGSTWVWTSRRRTLGPFSEPLDTLYQQGNGEPCRQFGMAAEVRN